MTLEEANETARKQFDQALEDARVDDGGQAFPVPGGPHSCGRPGMSVRMWLAGQVLSHALTHGDPAYQAIRALEFADALIEEIKTPKPQGTKPDEQNPNNRTDPG